jgi:hypothetical protein
MRKLFAVTVCLMLLGLPIAPGVGAAPGETGGRIIRLVERINDVFFDERGASGPSLGDRLVLASNLFDVNGNPAGRNGADCVVVRIDHAAPAEEQQVVQCVVTVELAGGQITFQGLAQGLDNTFAVTGGTGLYRKVRGEALVRDRVFLQEADIEIKLFG